MAKKKQISGSLFSEPAISFPDKKEEKDVKKEVVEPVEKKEEKPALRNWNDQGQLSTEMRLKLFPNGATSLKKLKQLKNKK